MENRLAGSRMNMKKPPQPKLRRFFMRFESHVRLGDGGAQGGLIPGGA